MATGSNALSSEAAAYETLERLRWGGPPTSCPRCGATGRCYYLRPADGSSRRTRTGSASQRRVWKCAACRRQFSVLVGTILQGTRISLHAWIGVIADRAESGQAPDPVDVADRYGISRAGARQVVRRVELALTSMTTAGGVAG